MIEYYPFWVRTDFGYFETWFGANIFVWRISQVWHPKKITLFQRFLTRVEKEWRTCAKQHEWLGASPTPESRDRRLLHRGGILGVNLGGAKMNLSFVNCKTQDFLNHRDRSALGVQPWRNKGSLLWSVWQSLANLCRCRSPLGHYLPYTPFGRPVG